MKSSTLHRSNLSREKMSMIENIKPQNYGSGISNVNHYMNFQKKPELDVLWRDFEKNVQTKSRNKGPVVYAGIGFVLGSLFALCIAIIVGVTSYNSVPVNDFSGQVYKMEDPQTQVTIVPSDDAAATSTHSEMIAEEKYTVKAGDTLDDIAYRFYGKYDLNKIEEIMKLNNIKDATTIQIGQVLIIPLN